MIPFLKLIRLPNLLIIALTQYAMRWLVIDPIIESYNMLLFMRTHGKITNPHIITLQMTELQFFFLVLSTVMIAAAGYIINDYFDTRIDRVNRPDTVIIDRFIKRRVAMGAHLVINILGVGIGVVLAYQAGIWKAGIIHFFCAGGLWYYSTTFKRQLLVGNLLIAFFSALVPLIVMVFELPMLLKKHEVLITMFNLNFGPVIVLFILGFSFFAFMITLIREITKDAEDMQGDEEFGRHTLPLACGLTVTKIVLVTLIAIIMAVLGWFQYLRYEEKLTLYTISIIYITIALQLPLLFLVYRTIIAKEQKDFRFNHIFIKGIMLSGILYSAVIFYTYRISG